jgi:xylulokinase
LNAAAASAPPGSEGVLFLPLAGGHAAGFGPSCGGFVKMSLRHSRGHMTRAVMEGTAFELRWAVEQMRAAGIDVAELTLVGGAAKSAVWPQIVADVLDVPVTTPVAAEAAASGAAILAGVRAGLLPDAETGALAWRTGARRLEPIPAHQGDLSRAYAEYQAACAALRGL